MKKNKNKGKLKSLVFGTLIHNLGKDNKEQWSEKEVKFLHGIVSQKRKKEKDTKRHSKVKSTMFLNVKKQELSRLLCNTVTLKGKEKRMWSHGVSDYLESSLI